jgi:hypothetical protein
MPSFPLLRLCKVGNPRNILDDPFGLATLALGVVCLLSRQRVCSCPCPLMLSSANPALYAPHPLLSGSPRTRVGRLRLAGRHFVV